MPLPKTPKLLLLWPLAAATLALLGLTIADPTPVGACDCTQAQLISELEAEPGTPVPPQPLCLVTLESGPSFLLPCERQAVFDEEIFGAPQ